MKRAKKEVIHTDIKSVVMPKYNAFQTGHGINKKSKKARNKASRKENKKFCKDYY